ASPAYAGGTPIPDGDGFGWKYHEDGDGYYRPPKGKGPQPAPDGGPPKPDEDGYFWKVEVGTEPDGSAFLWQCLPENAKPPNRGDTYDGSCSGGDPYYCDELVGADRRPAFPNMRLR